MAATIAAVLAITLHEAAHGYVAKLFGDRTAEMLGRMHGITREMQDRFALRSHQRAAAARCIHEMNMVEIDVFVAHAIHWQQQAHDKERQAKAEEFNRRVVASLLLAMTEPVPRVQTVAPHVPPSAAHRPCRRTAPAAAAPRPAPRRCASAPSSGARASW